MTEWVSPFDFCPSLRPSAGRAAYQRAASAQLCVIAFDLILDSGFWILTSIFYLKMCINYVVG